jgi:hypothetical protein
MDEETQKELVRLAKQALTVIAVGRRDENLLYSLRDVIRRIEAENGTNA